MQDKSLTERQRYWLGHIQAWRKLEKRISRRLSGLAVLEQDS
jgi:hypothetical protein